MSKEAKRKKSPKCVCHLMWHLRKPESATPPHTPPQPSEPISSLSPCPPPTEHPVMLPSLFWTSASTSTGCTSYLSSSKSRECNLLLSFVWLKAKRRPAQRRTNENPRNTKDSVTNGNLGMLFGWIDIKTHA